MSATSTYIPTEPRPDGGSFISHLLCVAKRELQNVDMDTRYGGRGVELFPTPEMRIHSITATSGQEEVEPINQLDALTDAYVRRILAGCSRAGRFGGPSLDSIPDEQAGPDQQDPSRRPHSHSRLLFRARKRGVYNHINPRVPGLEENVHIACLSVG